MADETNPIRIGSIKSLSNPVLNVCLDSSANAPSIAGTDSKNEYLADSVLVNLSINAHTIVIPDLDMPGINPKA